jgi:hypothetical protein
MIASQRIKEQLIKLGPIIDLEIVREPRGRKRSTA